MANRFPETDRPLEPYLDFFGIQFNPTKRGNQKIRCPNPSHEDRTPSASVHLDKGLFNCQGCGAGGTAIDLIVLIEGVSLREAFNRSDQILGEGHREIPGEPQRREFGLPVGPRVHRRDDPGVSPWAGFGRR